MQKVFLIRGEYLPGKGLSSKKKRQPVKEHFDAIYLKSCNRNFV